MGLIFFGGALISWPWAHLIRCVVPQTSGVSVRNDGEFTAIDLGGLGPKAAEGHVVPSLMVGRLGLRGPLCLARLQSFTP